MALIPNPGGHAEVMRAAQSVNLFGMQDRMIVCLRQGNYRGALMLCRRALSLQKEERIPAREHRTQRPDREHLLRLRDQINALRLETRTS